jgi:hypothetical protein
MDAEEEEGEATAVAAELECRRLTQERSEEDDDGWETDEIDGDGGASGGDRDYNGTRN